MPPTVASATVVTGRIKRTGTFTLASSESVDVDVPRDRAHSLDAGPGAHPNEIAARVVQSAYRSYRQRGRKLHRANLSLRLQFEWQICCGAFRLCLQMISFALLLMAVQYTPTATMRSLYRSMESAFDFEGIKNLPDRDAFFDEGLKNIASRSKDFFALSSKYFESEGGSVELLRNTETFTEAKISGSIDLPIMLPEFSFSAWVRTDAQFARGYLVRKRLATAGQASELTCFGWHLDQVNGPSLRFGASDFFAKGWSEENAKQKMEQIELDESHEFLANEFHLLTVVVTFDGEHHMATFYQDLTELGSTVLPRPITDCYNNLEGYLVGDSGLTLAQLRFYPRRLTLTLIKEIHVIGTVLGDLATGSQPNTQMLSRLDTVSRSLGTTLAEVDQRVAAQQPRSEVDLVLQAVDKAMQEGSGGLTVSPPAPYGKLPVEERADEAVGRAYWQLLEGPYSMTEAPAGQARYFDPERFPSWKGTGMSVSLWIRKSLDCPNEVCGTYVFSAHPQGEASSVRCYSAWLEKDGVYFDNLESTQGWHYKVGIIDARFHMHSNHWRFVTFVWDEDSDDWLFYLDGQLVYKTPWGSPVKEADCAGDDGRMRVSVASRFPGWTYGVADEYFDMRMWVGKALSAAEVEILAGVPTPRGINLLQFALLPEESEGDYQTRTGGYQHLMRCTAAGSDNLQDSGWRDLFGHSCQWYFNNMVQFPALCELPDARLNCPIACKSLQPCLEAAPPDDSVYYAWKSIRKMERKSGNGTICLQSRLSAQEVAEQCRRWRDGNEDWREQAATWLYDMGDRTGGVEVSPSVRVNLTECEELLAAIDEDCSFDSDAVRNFTRELKTNGGDYSIGFWIKPLGERSMHDDGGFYPSVSFLSTISPPNSNLAFARYWTGSDGEARYRTSCPPRDQEQRLEENVEFLPSSRDGWTFMAFARVNSTASTGLTVTDLGDMREDAGAWKQCLYDDDMLFNAVEVNYPVLLSPIMMVPRALSVAKLQEIYYLQVNDMKPRDGPLVTNARRRQEVLDVKKRDLEPRSVLMATPLLFTTRVLPTAQCPFEYSKQLLKEQHAHVVDSKCAFPFRCSANIINHPEATISCAGEPQVAGTFFELEPREVKGGVGFADLLYSIADNEIVFRDGELRETREFIDSLTQRVVVLLVFFTPQYGITSVLEVDADVSGPVVEVETRLLHYTILEGAWLHQYIAVLGCQVLVAIVMAADVIAQWRSKWRRHRSWHAMRKSSKMAKSVTDLINIFMILTYVILQLPNQMRSASETSRILGSMTSIDWASSSVTLEQKKDAFFGGVLDLLDTIQVQTNLDMFLNVILLVSLLRIIQCTSLHPRLALLTGTLARAADDLWHTSILIVVIMCSFAGIGTWRFGSQYEEFGSFESSMRTEFKLMFGEFLDNWGASREMQAFVVLYYLVVFFLIVNFLLAIIVESYMQVRRYNEEIEYECEFFTDLAFSVVAFFYGKLNGWPSQASMGRAIGELRGKLSLGYSDLYRLGLFRQQRDVEAFLAFYSRLGCLQPPQIDSTPYSGGMSEEGRGIVREVANLLNIKPPKLKDVAKGAQLRRLASTGGDASPISAETLRSFSWAHIAANDSFRAALLRTAQPLQEPASGNGDGGSLASGPAPASSCEGLQTTAAEVEEPMGRERRKGGGAEERVAGELEPAWEGAKTTLARRRSQENAAALARGGHANGNADSAREVGAARREPGGGVEDGSVAGARGGAAGEDAWRRAEELRSLGDAVTRLAWRVAAGLAADDAEREMAALRERWSAASASSEASSRVQAAPCRVKDAQGRPILRLSLSGSEEAIEVSQPAPAELC